jgi:hypothetical protein
VSLSDRDNIETNVPWVYWPEGKDKGLSPDFILPFLRRVGGPRGCTRAPPPLSLPSPALSLLIPTRARKGLPVRANAFAGRRALREVARL